MVNTKNVSCPKMLVILKIRELETYMEMVLLSILPTKL